MHNDQSKNGQPVSVGSGGWFGSHTPGPWQVSPFGNVWAPRNRHAIVAKLDPERAVDDAQLAANARLIAAAPDLLDALKRLIAAEDASIEKFTSREIDEITTALHQARCAVENAETSLPNTGSEPRRTGLPPSP